MPLVNQLIGTMRPKDTFQERIFNHDLWNRSEQINIRQKNTAIKFTCKKMQLSTWTFAGSQVALFSRHIIEVLYPSSTRELPTMISHHLSTTKINKLHLWNALPFYCFMVMADLIRWMWVFSINKNEIQGENKFQRHPTNSVTYTSIIFISN